MDAQTLQEMIDAEPCDECNAQRGEPCRPYCCAATGDLGGY